MKFKFNTMVILISLVSIDSYAGSIGSASGAIFWDSFTMSGIDYEWLHQSSGVTADVVEWVYDSNNAEHAADDEEVSGWGEAEVDVNTSNTSASGKTTSAIVRSDAAHAIFAPGAFADTISGSIRRGEFRALEAGTLFFSVNYLMQISGQTHNFGDWAYAGSRIYWDFVNASVSEGEIFTRLEILEDNATSGASFGPTIKSGTFSGSLNFEAGHRGGFEILTITSTRGTVPVPEPSIISLMALSIIMLGCAKQMHQRKFKLDTTG